MRLGLPGVAEPLGSLVANDGVDLVAQPREIALDDRPVVRQGPGTALAARSGMVVHRTVVLLPVLRLAGPVGRLRPPAAEVTPHVT